MMEEITSLTTFFPDSEGILSIAWIGRVGWELAFLGIGFVIRLGSGAESGEEGGILANLSS